MMSSSINANKEGRIVKNGIQHLIELNKKHSALFSDPGMKLERQLYREKHPTEIAFIKCMDGRVHGPVMTKTPLGIILPWRNLGGKFDLGWFGFAQSIKEWVEYSVRNQRNCLVFVTYHYSRGDIHRGCRGFNYDRKAAEDFALNLKEQFDRVFGRRVVFAVQVGIETDLESLILHGDTGEVIDLADVNNLSEAELIETLIRLYPTMPQRILLDMLPLVQGNIEHIAEVKALNRPIVDSEHKESVLGVGRGFDWLHETNLALIVGPFDPYFDKAVQTAATLIKSNIDEGRVILKDDGGIVLLASAPYRETGFEERLAQEKARFLNKFAYEAIRIGVPDLLPYLQQLTVTVDQNTRKINILK